MNLSLWCIGHSTQPPASCMRDTPARLGFLFFIPINLRDNEGSLTSWHLMGGEVGFERDFKCLHASALPPKTWTQGEMWDWKRTTMR